MTDMRRNRLPAFMREPISVHMPQPVVNVLPEIMMKPKSDGDVWLEAWCAVAGSSATMETTVADSWADRCLAQYRSRFK